MAAVVIRTRNRVALTQCRTRSAPSKRASRAVSDGRVVSTIRPADPRVDVVPALLPVTGRGRAAGDADAVEPLAGLVAVHRCDVEPHGPAVLPRHDLALHR